VKKNMKISFSKISILIVLLTIIVIFSAKSNEHSDFDYVGFFKKKGSALQKDYHIPYGDDLSYWGTDKNTFFYKSLDEDGQYKAPYWTKGDFNKDSITDVCYLLFHNREENVDLFVFLSINQKNYQIYKVAPANKLMGVSTLKVSKKDYIANAIKLFEFEGHSNSYLWDKTTKGFVNLPKEYKIVK